MVHCKRTHKSESQKKKRKIRSSLNTLALKCHKVVTIFSSAHPIFLKSRKMAEASLLEKVKLRVPGQNWVLINMVGPGLRQQVKKSAFRILGTFDTEAEAEAHAEEYRKLDDRFDLYVCQMYQFLPVLEEVHDVGNVKYDQKEINTLLDTHEKTRTQTQEWNKRIEEAKKGGEDKWGLAGL